MRRLRILLPLVLLLSTMITVSARGEGDGWMTNFEQAKDRAQAEGKPLVIHFMADWCPPCRKMEASVLHTPEVLAAIKDGVVAVQVNCGDREDLPRRFGVESLPTDVILEPSGARMIESSGYRGVSEYVGTVQRAKDRYAELAKARTPKSNPIAKTETPAPPSVTTQPATPSTTVPVITDSGTAETQLASSQTVKPLLDGYCPVTLWKSRRWVKGISEFTADHKGQMYHFASAEALKSFQESPDRYTPRFLGCDPVEVWEKDRAIRGETRYGAFYDDELYLFANSSNRTRFKQDPDRFVRTRVVLRPDQIESVIR
ncbi:MAG: thioredoxin family protein [Planctomycetaceae bacterium]